MKTNLKKLRGTKPIGIKWREQDHKENFNNNPTVRFINPVYISKAILDTANKNIREAMDLNEWRNTDTVIYWFKGIRNKHLCKFVIFDIKEYYLSITENLLKKP